MWLLVDELNIRARGCKRIHLWKVARGMGKKRRRCLVLPVALTPAFEAEVTCRRLQKRLRSLLAGSFHARLLGSQAVATFSQHWVSSASAVWCLWHVALAPSLSEHSKLSLRFCRAFSVYYLK